MDFEKGSGYFLDGERTQMNLVLNNVSDIPIDLLNIKVDFAKRFDSEELNQSRLTKHKFEPFSLSIEDYQHILPIARLKIFIYLSFSS